MNLLLWSLACKTPPATPAPAPEPAPAPAPEPAPEPVPSDPSAGNQGSPCLEGKCAAEPAGLVCVEYFGIAGPRGPRFSSCEIPCAAEGSACPEGQSCRTIADGPGAVCR